MGEIADDCYDRALEEMMDPRHDPYEDYAPWYRATPRPRRPQPTTTPDDFEVIP